MAKKIIKNSRPRFDYINFAYGVGAAVILIAAMFKFLGWNYANEIFIVGLTSEAIVFLISAFQWKTKRKSYKWEKVFPGLTQKTSSKDEKIDLTVGIQAYYKNTESIIHSTEALDNNLKNLGEATASLSESVNRVKEQINRIEKSAINYEEELEILKTRITKTNDFYSEMFDLVKDKENDKDIDTIL